MGGVVQAWSMKTKPAAMQSGDKRMRQLRRFFQGSASPVERRRVSFRGCRAFLHLLFVSRDEAKRGGRTRVRFRSAQASRNGKPGLHDCAARVYAGFERRNAVG